MGMETLGATMRETAAGKHAKGVKFGLPLSSLRGQQQEQPLHATAKMRSRRKRCRVTSSAWVSPAREGEGADFL